MATGYGGTPKKSNAQIMKALNLTQGQYSYHKGLLVKHVDQVMRTHG